MGVRAGRHPYARLHGALRYAASAGLLRGIGEPPTRSVDRNVVDIDPHEVQIGMPVQVKFVQVDDELTLPLFAPS